MGRSLGGLCDKKEREAGLATAETQFGKMQCLHALGDWQQLSRLCSVAVDGQDKVAHIANGERPYDKAIASFATAAAWGLGDWDTFGRSLTLMDPNASETLFMKSVLAVNQSDNIAAAEMIERTRESLDVELSALIGESYSRAYK